MPKNIQEKGRESLIKEETEIKKDKERLKDKIKYETDTLYTRIKPSRDDFITANRNIMDAIDQHYEPDEQEVLTQDWIDKYSYNIEEYWEIADMMPEPQYAVSVENLQNVIVSNKKEIDQAYKDGYDKGIELMEVMNMVYEDGEFVERMKPLVAVKDSEGNVYTMPSSTNKSIIEINYTTSYYQFTVQDVIMGEDGETLYPEKTIIVPINEDNWVDFIAVKESEIGELVEGVVE